MQGYSLPSERFAIVGTIDPDAYTAATYTSDLVNMKNFDSLAAVIMGGTYTTDGAISAALYEATTSSGAGAQAISGKSSTGLETTGYSDGQAVINLRADEMDTADGYDWAYLSMTVTGTCDGGAILLGFDPRYGPASDNDLSSVKEIIT